MTPTALTIAGSDSGGGAGIQADLKSFSAHGVFGTSVVTALTAQNTRAVTQVALTSPDMVLAQIQAVLSDIAVHAVKIGMLATPQIIAAVAEGLSGYTGPVVLDPVMVAKSGDKLLQPDAIDAMLRLLVPRATIVTPNVPEAACLLGRADALSHRDRVDQGQALLARGTGAVLMKGGHAEGATCTDLLISGQGITTHSAPRIDTRNTHGTGCTLSSAIAAGLAKGMALPDAVARAHSWLHQAIVHADQLSIGQGHGPVHHFHEVWT